MQQWSYHVFQLHNHPITTVRMISCATRTGKAAMLHLYSIFQGGMMAIHPDTININKTTETHLTEVGSDCPLVVDMNPTPDGKLHLTL